MYCCPRCGMDIQTTGHLCGVWSGLSNLPPERICRRCDKPESLHSGMEKFCPIYATFEAK